MLESREFFFVGLSTAPPSSQLWTAPTKADISAESRVRNWVGTSASALVPDPTRRNSPPLSEFLGGQHFEKRLLGRRVLCSGLCSSVFHAFPINKFWCMAVLKTDVHYLTHSAHRKDATDNQSGAARPDFRPKGIAGVTGSARHSMLRWNWVDDQGREWQQMSVNVTKRLRGGSGSPRISIRVVAFVNVWPSIAGLTRW
jgi:hypothetical protein